MTRHMQLDIWSDIACPWCYLGKRRLDKALATADLGDVVVRWRAFELDPQAPPDGRPREVLEQKLGGPARLQAAQERITTLGQGDGICYAFSKQTRLSNTRLAHRAIAIARDQHGEETAARVVDAFFRAYHEEGTDISPLAVVVEIAAQAGVDRTLLAQGLAGDAGLASVLQDEAMAAELGIGGVPCFVANMATAVSGAQEVSTLRAFLAEAGQKKARA